MRLLCVTLCISIGLVLPGVATGEQVVYDSGGFTGFPLGAISQNANWRGVGYNEQPGAPYGIVPAVVDLPDGNRVVKLAVPDSQTASSYLDLMLPAMPNATQGILTVSVDVLRENDGWASNLWWSMTCYPGSNTYIPTGLQWDAAGGPSQMLPLGSGGPGTPTVYGSFTRLTTILNFDTDRMRATYGGVSLGPVAFTGDKLPNLWYMWLSHDEATGSGPETVWIDNLRMTYVPEPAALWALGVALLACRRRR